MDITYCNNNCSIGKEASERFLTLQNSVFDAAFDFQMFTENCFKTCPYKDKHEEHKES